MMIDLRETAEDRCPCTGTTVATCCLESSPGALAVLRGTSRASTPGSQSLETGSTRSSSTSYSSISCSPASRSLTQKLLYLLVKHRMMFSKPDELYCNQDLTLMAIMIIKPSQSGPAKFILLKSQETFLYQYQFCRVRTVLCMSVSAHSGCCLSVKICRIESSQFPPSSLPATLPSYRFQVSFIS